MASKEEQSLLGDLQSSSEVSAAISSLLEEDHSVMGHTGSGSQMGFVPVEVRHMKFLHGLWAIYSSWRRFQRWILTLALRCPGP